MLCPKELLLFPARLGRVWLIYSLHHNLINNEFMAGRFSKALSHAEALILRMQRVALSLLTNYSPPLVSYIGIRNSVSKEHLQ